MATPRRWQLVEAARAVREGGLVAYPTEAVYGLGCDPCDEPAVLRLLELKQRGAEQGLILVAAELEQLRPYLGRTPPAMLARARRTWPGPVTWLMPAAAGVPWWLRGSHATLAVRVTAHPEAAALCRAVGDALVSTSANHHRQPPARTALQVRRRFGGEIDYVLNGAVGPSQRPTEIRDAATGRVVRPA